MMEWVSVSERLPEPEKWVLIHLDYNDPDDQFRMSYIMNKWGREGEWNGYDETKITHWCFPSPPGEKE